MARCEKIEAAACRAPATLPFADLCKLAECYGFIHRRPTGAHRIYKHPREPRLLNLQPRPDGTAKAYQVRELLDAIDRLPA